MITLEDCLRTLAAEAALGTRHTANGREPCSQHRSIPKYTGGRYHSTEFDTTAQPMEDVVECGAAEVRDSVMSWGRISKWLPWMELGDREGAVLSNATGLRLGAWEELPDVMKNEIRLNYPAFVAAPAFDTPRPRETSWTVFRDSIDAKRARAGTGAGPATRP